MRVQGIRGIQSNSIVNNYENRKVKGSCRPSPSFEGRVNKDLISAYIQAGALAVAVLVFIGSCIFSNKVNRATAPDEAYLAQTCTEEVYKGIESSVSTQSRPYRPYQRIRAWREAAKLVRENLPNGGALTSGTLSGQIINEVRKVK